jgi:hypothetical protein
MRVDRPDMQGISSESVAVVGDGLPVEPIDTNDFERILGNLAPVLRAPGMAVQAQGNQFTLQFLPNRASVQVDAPLPEGSEAKLLDAMRFYLKEYAGPRSVSALGHNFQGSLDCGDATGRQVLDTLLNTEKLGPVLKADPRAGSVTLFFVRGGESRGQLVLSIRDEDSHTIEWAFNFHYDLKQPESLNAFDALDKFAESRSLAEESVAAMQAWRESI